MWAASEIDLVQEPEYWAGLLNTHFWVDRAAGVTAGIYSQPLPFVTAPGLEMYQAFEGALHASL
jgi:methyl acetate hydrolase